MPRAIAALALLSTTLPACFLSIDRTLIETARTDGGAPIGGADAGSCLEDRVLEPQAKAFCIDVGEVTNESYALFLAGGRGLANQPAFCQFNMDLIPESGWPVSPDRALEPVEGVDWCDARA